MPLPTKDPRPSREFPREGYTLRLETDGIELSVDDYHPQPLKLSWALLDQLRREAAALPPRDAAGGAAGA